MTISGGWKELLEKLIGSGNKENVNTLHKASEIIDDNVQDRLKNVSPKLQDEVSSCSDEEKFPNKNILTLFGQELLPVNTFTQTFLQSILSSVDSQDPVVANAWMETLLDVIDLLPKEIIKGEILTLAVNKGQLSQPVSSRLLCCRMLGKLCTKFDPYVIKKEVLPVVLSLCQDVDYEVRCCMCKQLYVVAKGIGLEATKSAILPELVELSNDEESFVRLAGIETVVQMLPLLDDETCIQAIIPLVIKFCENSIRSEDSTMPVVSRQIGRLCHGLASLTRSMLHANVMFQSNLILEQKMWFLKFFRNLSKLGLPHHKKDMIESNLFCPMPDLVPEVDNRDRYKECRHACAYNFPAMVLFAGTENFKEELYETFSELCSDPFQNVRKTMASGFYEVAKMLKYQSPLLLPELVRLLKDDALEVLRGIIPHLPDSLKMVCQEINLPNETKNDQVENLVKALIRCEETTSVTSNWRLHADFLTRLSCLPFCLSADIIFKTFVPLLFVKLHTARPIPCRMASAYSLLVFLRNTPKLEQRTGIINEIIRELCYGRSCHKRMLFIKVCELVIDQFSKAFFKQHFFRPLLNLSEDPVPNIRLRLCVILPRLKSLIKLPKDSLLLQDLESCVRSLMTDEKDRDVAAAVSKGIEELDKIEVATEPTSRRTSCVELDTDLEDVHKELEEKHLIEMELRTKHSNEDKSTNSPTSSKNLNRPGRIPIRKSGTLPKQTKAKEFKRNTLTRPVSSSPSKTSAKGIKQEKRLSRPVSCIESSRNSKVGCLLINKDTQTMNETKMLLCTSSQSSIPTTRSKSPCLLRPSSRRLSSSISSKQQLDRCPSPMPSRHCTGHSPDNSIVQPDKNISIKTSFSAASLNVLSLEEKAGWLFDSHLAGRSISTSRIEKTGKSPSVKHSSLERTANHPGTPLPSPEVTRRLHSTLSSNPGSRIPTPNTKRRSTII